MARNKKLPNGLTPQQDKFAQNVAKGMTAQKAALDAGYAKASAHSQASDLLKKPEIKAAVKKICDKAAERVEISRAKILSELLDNAMIGKEETPILNKNGDQIGTRRENLNASNQAFGLVGKEIGMFVNRTEVTVKEAQEFAGKMMDVVFGVVTDEDQQQAIIAGIDALIDGEG